MITVTANGRPVELPDGATLTSLLDALGVSPKGVAAMEHNGEAVSRTDHAAQALADGDRIELGRAVGEALPVRGPCTVQAFRDPEIGLGITDVNTRFGGAFPAPMYAAPPGRTYPELIARMAAGERVDPHIGEFRAGMTFTRWYWHTELDEQMQPTGRDAVEGGPRPPR